MRGVEVETGEAELTHGDAKEAVGLLLLAGVPKEKITNEALIVADALIQDMNRRLAQALIERFFPEWLKQAETDLSEV